MSSLAHPVVATVATAHTPHHIASFVFTRKKNTVVFRLRDALWRRIRENFPLYKTKAMRNIQRQVLIWGILVAVIAITKHRIVRSTAISCLVFMLVLALVQRQYNCFKAHLIATDIVNESLVLDGELAGEPTLFMLDTGYAGPPVLSSSYLAISHKCNSGSVEQRYKKP